MLRLPNEIVSRMSGNINTWPDGSIKKLVALIGNHTRGMDDEMYYVYEVLRKEQVRRDICNGPTMTVHFDENNMISWKDKLG